MKDPVAIIGIGEIGGVIARGMLRAGHPVYPVTRDMDMATAAQQIPEPTVVVLAVAEKDLHPTLEQIPTRWRDRLALIQNELLPRDWQAHDLDHPTVASIWFEKKPGQDVKVVMPSPAQGPHAGTLVRALEALEIPARELRSETELLDELVVKNLYILTTNIGGLAVGGGDVETLWRDHRETAEAVFDDVLALQEALVDQSLDRDALLERMLAAFDGDPAHKCMGRSAPQRLQRALEMAREQGVEVATLAAIGERAGG